MCLFRDGVQLCSGLVDLVVCVRRHGGGGHRSALASERFVGLVAEDIAGADSPRRRAPYPTPLPRRLAIGRRAGIRPYAAVATFTTAPG